MIKKQIGKVSKARTLSSTEYIGLPQKKQRLGLFKASSAKLRHLGNYKDFMKHLLSDDIDFEPAD